MKRVLVLIHKKPVSEDRADWLPFRDALQAGLGDGYAVDIDALRELVYQLTPGDVRIYNPDT